MNNSWQIGWETIGVIVSIIGLLISIILEWDRLKESKVVPNGIFFVFMLGGGYAIGYAISQAQLWWRIGGLILGAIVGAFFGAVFADEDSYKGILTIHLIAVIVGATVGFWLTNPV